MSACTDAHTSARVKWIDESEAQVNQNIHVKIQNLIITIILNYYNTRSLMQYKFIYIIASFLLPLPVYF